MNYLDLIIRIGKAILVVFAAISPVLIHVVTVKNDRKRKRQEDFDIVLHIPLYESIYGLSLQMQWGTNTTEDVNKLYVLFINQLSTIGHVISREFTY